MKWERVVTYKRVQEYPETEEVFRYTKPNRKVYIFVKHPDFQLEPQQQVVMNVIHLHSPIVRFELCKEVSKVLFTRGTISNIVSRATIFLAKMGCILIMQPGEYRTWLERQKDKEMNAEIIQNDRGGWSIKTGNDEPVGNYPTEGDARTVLRINHYDEQNSKPDPEALISND